jgi:nucleoside-diphosphate-sugar epimerase
LAIEKGATGFVWHAVTEEGVAMRDIVETLGRRLDLPVRSLSADDVPAFFRQFAMFAGLDMAASSALTQQALGWEPTWN